jgi:DNA invertase Pin-like site-specific DNA recombinase
MMIYGYIRVSTRDQNLESQKNLISRYGMDNKLLVDTWFEVEMSSRKSTAERRIDEPIRKLIPV